VPSEFGFKDKDDLASVEPDVWLGVAKAISVVKLNPLSSAEERLAASRK
jgi:hypothetical protein